MVYLSNKLHNLRTLFVYGIIAIGVSYILPYGFDFANASLEIGSSTDTTNYVPYSNSELGISFEYPSTWTLEEKQNRFDTGAEASLGFVEIMINNKRMFVIRCML